MREQATARAKLETPSAAAPTDLVHMVLVEFALAYGNGRRVLAAMEQMMPDE
jgi:hypothetical protein